MSDDTILKKFQKFKAMIVSADIPCHVLLEMAESYITSHFNDSVVEEIPVIDGQMTLFDVTSIKEGDSLLVLHEKLNAAETALNSINTTEDYIKHGLNTNRSEKMGIRYLIKELRNGEETHTACVNMRNFLDRHGIATEERSHNHFIIKPHLKGVHAYKNETWYSDLCLLLENGYCITEKEFKYPIFDACRKLSVWVSYKNYFGLDYIVTCKEYDYLSLKRRDCLEYFLEKAKDDLNECAQDSTWKTPKPGLFKEWADAAFRYERLRQMIDETYHRHSDFEKVIKIYVGTIGGYAIGTTRTEKPHPYIKHIDFHVEYTSNMWSSGEDRVILNIEHELGIEWFVNGYHDIERHKRYDEGKDTTLRAYVDNINVIRRLEWVEK